MDVSLYARVSSDRQDVDLSISAQLRALREYAEREGHVVVREFVDEAESGRTAQRPVFQEMVRLACQNPSPFSAILVWKLSRFARNREDSIIYKSFLRKHGVQVISINEPVSEGPTGRMLEGIIEVIDEFYSANLGQDVRRGMREAALRGFWVGTRPPFGYRPVKVQDGARSRTRLEPDPLTAPTVRALFGMAAEGTGLKRIVSRMNSEGVPSPSGGNWGKGYLHHLLHNETYLGVLTWGKASSSGVVGDQVRMEDAWEPLVTRAIFEAAHHALRGNSFAAAHPRRVASPYLLSGMLQCRRCGASMMGQPAKSGSFHYYVCGTAFRKGRQLCDARPIRKELIEGLVLDNVRSIILQKEHLIELVRLTNEELRSSLAGVEDRVAQLRAQRAEVEARLGRLYEALETGKLELDDVAPRLKEHRLRVELLSRAEREATETLASGQVELVDKKTVLAYLREFGPLLEFGSPAERRTILKGFLRSVEVTGDDVTISYSLPIPPEVVTAVSVPAIVLSGGEEGTRTLTPVGTWS